MILVLCEEYDLAATWAAERLRERGLAITVVTGAALAAARWEHRVGRAGARLEFRLAGGERICSGEIGGVLNRLCFLPSAWLQRIGGPDRDYAVQEMLALYLSWLHAMTGPVLNPATPQGLCGNWRHPSVWAVLAGRSGLPTSPYRQTSADDPDLYWQAAGAPGPATAFVAGSRALLPPDLPAPLRAACLRLARQAGTPLLGIDFSPAADGTWRFTGASVMPNLVRGGEKLADDLAEALAA